MIQFLKSLASRKVVGSGRSIAIAVALTVTLGVASTAYAIFIRFEVQMQASCTSDGVESLKVNSVFNLDASTNVLDYVIKIPEMQGAVQSAALFNINDTFVDEASCSVTGATTIEVLDESLSGSYTLTSQEVLDLQNEEHYIVLCVTDGETVYYWWFRIIKGFGTIPTVSQWGLFAMTGLVLAAGTIAVRRRRRTAA